MNIETGDKKGKNMAAQNEGEKLEWKEIRMEHVVQDEWIDFRRSAYQFPTEKCLNLFIAIAARTMLS